MSAKTFKALDVRGRLRVSQHKLVPFSGPRIVPLGKRKLT